MSRGSTVLLTGLALTLLCAVESYVATIEAYYQAELKRLAQPTGLVEAALECGRPDLVGTETEAATKLTLPETVDTKRLEEDADQPLLPETRDDP